MTLMFLTPLIASMVDHLQLELKTFKNNAYKITFVYFYIKIILIIDFDFII